MSDQKYKCMACGRVWNKWDLYKDPSTTAETLTCGDLFCGGVVIYLSLEPIIYKQDFQERDEKMLETEEYELRCFINMLVSYAIMIGAPHSEVETVSFLVSNWIDHYPKEMVDELKKEN